jgi:hypothetical protein
MAQYKANRHRSWRIFTRQSIDEFAKVYAREGGRDHARVETGDVQHAGQHAIEARHRGVGHID